MSVGVTNIHHDKPRAGQPQSTGAKSLEGEI